MVSNPCNHTSPLCYPHPMCFHVSLPRTWSGHQQGILCHALSFLGTPELLSTYMAFIYSFKKYCDPLWAVDTKSLAQFLLNLMPLKSRPAWSLESTTKKVNLWEYHFHNPDRPVFFFSIFYHLHSRLAPSALSLLSPPG